VTVFIGIMVTLALILSFTSFTFAMETRARDTKTGISVPQEIKDRKEQLKNLFAEAKSIREKLKAIKGEVKERVAQIKDTFANMSGEEKAEAKEKLKALKAVIEADRLEIKVIRSQLKTMTEQMKVYRVQLKEAMGAKDYTKVSAILDSMIKLKTEKNTKLNQLMELKKNMIEKIKI